MLRWDVEVVCNDMDRNALRRRNHGLSSATKAPLKSYFGFAAPAGASTSATYVALKWHFRFPCPDVRAQVALKFYLSGTLGFESVYGVIPALIIVPPAIDWTLICSSCGLSDGIHVHAPVDGAALRAALTGRDREGLVET